LTPGNAFYDVAVDGPDRSPTRSGDLRTGRRSVARGSTA